MVKIVAEALSGALLPRHSCLYNFKFDIPS
jgi:hypothetical protein